MKKISTCELKTAWRALHNTTADTLWREINIELAKRLGKTEYQKFIARSR